MKNFGTKLFTIIKEHKNILFLSLGLAILNIVFLGICFSSRGLSFGKTFILILVLSLVLEFLLVSTLIYTKKKQWKIEKIFLVIGLPIGLIFTFALPISCAPDEVSHFYRIYEITGGTMVSATTEEGEIGSYQNANLPATIDNLERGNVHYGQVIDNFSIRADNEEEVFVVTSAYGYNILSYLPHVTGMWIGKTIGLPILGAAYLAKIFHLLTCITLIYFALKLIPFLKKALFFIAFLPITIQSMSSLSADGFIICVSLLFISYVLHLIYSEKNIISKKQLAYILLLCIFISLSKVVYAPLCFLLFAIPKEKFGNTKIKLMSIFLLGIITFAILLLWIMVMPSMQSVSDTGAQISSIIHNPFKYFAILINSLSQNGPMYLHGILGRYLEWFDVVLSPLYVIASGIIFVVMCVKNHEQFTVNKSLRYLSIAILALTATMTFTIMYIQWTKVGETVIDGVQGRYFLPEALLIALVCLPTTKPSSKKQLPIKAESHNYYLYTFIVFESVYAIATIVCTHI